jgi:FdhD protein
MAFADGAYTTITDVIAVESSLAVIVNGEPAYYCMRMPGMDRELALGLCYSDGRIRSSDDLKSVQQQNNSTVTIDINDTGMNNSDEIKIIRSSAGIIAKNQDSIPVLSEAADHLSIRFTSRRLFDLQNDFSARQKIFKETGATHAAALYDEEGLALVFAEDVGRHNALDKCIGKLLLEKRLHQAVYCILSSRLSYEMVMKTARAGIRVTAGASAPTGFAVDLAKSKGLTLIGFLRTGRFNVYSGEWRVDTSL